MVDVQRYNVICEYHEDGCPQAVVFPAPAGHYVKFEDYDTLRQQLAASAQEVERLTGALTEANRIVERQQAEILELKAKKFARFNNDECWIYQGDGDDHLESLVCPVVIAPHVLLDMKKRLSAAESRQGE